MRRSILIAIFLLPTARIHAQEPPPGLSAAAASPRNEAKTSKSPPSAPLLVHGDLSAEVVQTGETIRFWLTFENRADQPLSDIYVAGLYAPGFKSSCYCQISTERIPCLSAPELPRANALGASSSPPGHCSGIVSPLMPGQSFTVWGELQAESPHSREKIKAIVSWSDVGPLFSSELAPIGEIAIEDRWQIRGNALAGFLYGVLKDFALPLILLILTVAVGVYDKRKETRRLAHEKDLEDQRKREEERRSHISQTWVTMLPESHKLATELYMPIAAAVRGAVRELENYEAAKRELSSSTEETGEHAVAQKKLTESRRAAFYYLLLFLRRVRHLAEVKGGFYFKSRAGEELARGCLESFRDKFLEVDEKGIALVSQCFAPLDFFEKRAPFLQKMDADPKTELSQYLSECFVKFEEWLDSAMPTEALKFLKGLRSVLTYEMNRPYFYWYEEQEEPLILDDQVSSAFDEVKKRIVGKLVDKVFEIEIDRYIRAEKLS
jgi:hypothetical protein